jgi:hypothetical protein
MRSRSDIYRARAEECSHQATLPQNAAHKDRLLKLADEWTKLAMGAKNAPAGTGRAKRVAASFRVHVRSVASTGP